MYDLQNRNEYLQNALEERDSQLKRTLMDLEEANKKIERMESSSAPEEAVSYIYLSWFYYWIFFDQIQTRAATPNDDKRRLEDQLVAKNNTILEERVLFDLILVLYNLTLLLFHYSEKIWGGD